MNTKLKKVAVTINSIGFFLSLMCLLVAYPSFYRNVIAPSDAKRGFFNAMFIIGGFVAAVVIIFFVSLLKKLNSSANKNIPVIIFGILIAVLSIATPYGMSIMLGEKVNWLTPTIVGNGLLFAYIAYVVAMGFAGGSSVFVVRKLVEASKHSILPIAITAVVSFVSVGLFTTMPMIITYEKVFLVTGIITTVLAITSTIIELVEKKKS